MPFWLYFIIFAFLPAATVTIIFWLNSFKPYNYAEQLLSEGYDIDFLPEPVTEFLSIVLVTGLPLALISSLLYFTFLVPAKNPMPWWKALFLPQKKKKKQHYEKKVDWIKEEIAEAHSRGIPPGMWLVVRVICLWVPVVVSVRLAVRHFSMHGIFGFRAATNAIEMILGASILTFEVVLFFKRKKLKAFQPSEIIVHDGVKTEGKMWREPLLSEKARNATNLRKAKDKTLGDRPNRV